VSYPQGGDLAEGRVRSYRTACRKGERSWESFPHFRSNTPRPTPSSTTRCGPAHDEDAFAGPFDVPESSATPLVIGTTYDPATPYSGAVRLVEDLGNARLLTMEG
jgi:hypothetical protein